MLLTVSESDGMYGIKSNRYLKKNIVLCALCAGQAMFALTLSVYQARKIEHGIKINLILYFWGTILLFLLFMAVTFMSKRPVVSVFICLLFLNGIALINYYELLFHGTVLTHQDIHNFSIALHQIPNYTFQLTRPVQGIVLSFLFMVFLLTVFYMIDLSILRNRLFGGAAAAACVIISYVLVFSPFSNIKNNGWSWELQYYTDSFVTGTLENIKHSFSPYKKLEEYTESEIRNTSGMPGTASSYPDIIYILNETYYDVNHLLDFEPDVPYMKNYDNLKAVKGYAAVPYSGGGTNASEYELLTSNSMMLLNTVTPFNDLRLSGSRNVTEYLESLGYSSMAAHTEPGGNYHRVTAWKELGFDFTYFRPEFTEMMFYEKRWFGSDSSAFKNFIRFYESMPEDKPRFAYLLTIQNHGDWDRNDETADEVHIGKPYGMSNYDHGRMNEFLTCIKQTDDTIREITEYFSGLSRKVVVCMVGDHCPSILTSFEPVSTDSPGKDSLFSLRKRQVPYFIWKNYEEMNSSYTLPANKSIDLCALTPYVLKASGLPLSPYYYQLLKVSENVQCLTGLTEEENGSTRIGFLKTDGSEESIDSGTETGNLVREYYFMEYNNLHSGIRTDSLFAPW